MTTAPFSKTPRSCALLSSWRHDGQDRPDKQTTKFTTPPCPPLTGDESVYEAVDRWLPEPFTEYLTSVNGFGGRYRFEGTFVQLCWECLQYVYTLAWNIAFIFTILVQYHEWNLKRKQRSTPSLNFDDTSKFWGEKYICIDSSLRVICKWHTS